MGAVNNGLEGSSKGVHLHLTVEWSVWIVSGRLVLTVVVINEEYFLCPRICSDTSKCPSFFCFQNTSCKKLAFLLPMHSSAFAISGHISIGCVQGRQDRQDLMELI